MAGQMLSRVSAWHIPCQLDGLIVGSDNQHALARPRASMAPFLTAFGRDLHDWSGVLAAGRPDTSVGEPLSCCNVQTDTSTCP